MPRVVLLTRPPSPSQIRTQSRPPPPRFLPRASRKARPVRPRSRADAEGRWRVMGAATGRSAAPPLRRSAGSRHKDYSPQRAPRAPSVPQAGPGGCAGLYFLPCSGTTFSFFSAIQAVTGCRNPPAPRLPKKASRQGSPALGGSFGHADGDGALGADGRGEAEAAAAAGCGTRDLPPVPAVLLLAALPQRRLPASQQVSSCFNDLLVICCWSCYILLLIGTRFSLTKYILLNKIQTEAVRTSRIISSRS